MGSDRALTPVVAHILLVAIALIIVSTVGGFVFGIGDHLMDPIPAASLDANQDGESVRITHQGGDSLIGERVSVKGGNLTGDMPETFQSGDQIEVEPTHETLKLVWETDEGGAVLARFNVVAAEGETDGDTGETDDEGSFDFVSMDKSKGGYIIFTINNADTEEAVITEVSLDLTNYGEYTGDEIYIDAQNRKEPYDADGTLKGLNSQNASIPSGNDEDVEFKSLKEGSTALGNLTLVRTTDDDWDVAVSLKLGSGKEQTFYFEENS